MSDSPQIETILCEEVFDENSVPSEEEVIDYASKIGIDPKNEPHLLPIAVNGLMHPLPPEWKPCYDSNRKTWYYFNSETEKSQWEHPLDDFYRQVVKRGRSEGYSSAGDDDSKTTAKEDLKSFEEASDILSSKSVDIKPEASEDKREFVMMGERGPLMKGSQPLLLRRKQLQSGQDPLHVAKLINSTLRQSLPKEDVPMRSIYSDMPLPVPALRRSHTSDVITPHPPPIKGILRESSFSGSMSSSAKGSSVRFMPSQGDVGTAQSEGEDEKKRSVRFADFERQSLDIRFELSDSDETYSDVDDDNSTSSSPEGEKGIKDIEVKMKPKLLSPLQNTFSPSSDFPRTRKFTVTPVKETSFGFPVSNLKGLFRADSVGPLDSDSDLSLGVKGNESPPTGIGKELENLFHKDTLHEMELSPPSDAGQMPSESSPVKVSRDSAKHLDSYSKLSPQMKRSSSPSVRIGKELQDLAQKLSNPKLDDSPPAEGSLLVDHSPIKQPQSQLRRIPAVADMHALELIGDGPNRTTNSGTDLTEYASALSIVTSESEENLAEAQKEKFQNWQKKLDDEMKKQIEELKALQSENLARLKENLVISEELEKNKLKEDFEENIKKLKDSLEAEYIEKEKELRDSHKKRLDELSSELQKQHEQEMESIRLEHREMIQKWKEEKEEALRKEKVLLDDNSFESIKKIKAELKDKMDELKAQSEAQLMEVTTVNENKVAEVQLKLEELIRDLQLRHQNEIKELEDNHKMRMEVMLREKESELLRSEGEWEDRLTATSLSQKAHLESLEKEHEGRLARLRADWEREEAEMRRRRMPIDQQQVPVDYEKLRCEKRLLEDKYRTLKEKYIQLKKDVKIAVEKKLQARTRRKRGEELESEEPQIAERPRNLNKEFQPSHLMTPKITVGEVSPRDVTDPSSDDQYTLSYSQPADKCGSGKKVRSHGRDRTPTSRIEDSRSPMEEISGDIYLRHPLSSLGLSRSAEVDFYRQRMLSEEEQVVRESLEGQRREGRDTLDNNNTLSLHQQERDLNELEVSIHRTRALFGEKMIRLRLLGQTLSRLADDTTSPSSSAGGEVMSPTNILQNLDNINAEIREIWNQLNKNQAGLSSYGGPVEASHKTEDKSAYVHLGKSSGHHHRPSKRSEIEARLQGLRDWLQKPPPPDWAQLTL